MSVGGLVEFEPPILKSNANSSFALPKLHATSTILNRPKYTFRSILLQVVPGRLGARRCAGYELRFVVGMHDAEVLSTFTHAGTCLWSFLGLLRHPKELELRIDESHVNREYRPWGGPGQW